MLTIAQVLKATGSRLCSGEPDRLLSGITIDSRKVQPGEVFIALRGERFDGHDFIGEAVKKGASCVIRESARAKPASTGRAAVIAVKDTVKALGDLASFIRSSYDIPLIAVTGSNGKTTTKEMISWVLSGSYRVLKNEGTKNNHIGVPLTLFSLGRQHDIAVLEIGTNHFGEIAALTRIAQPTVGILTGIGPAHLEFFGDLKGVFKEKWALMKGLLPPSVGIVNADAPFLKKYSTRGGKGAFIIGAGIRQPCDFRASGVRYRAQGLEFTINKKYRFTLKTHGYYNIYNALLAVSAARIFGLGYGQIASRLSSFEFPPGRLKCIETGTIRIFDDTYNANPASLAQALEALARFPAKGRKVFVMGDMLELGTSAASYHRRAGRDASRVCDILITVGELSRLAGREALRQGLKSAAVVACRTSEEAAGILREKSFLSEGDIVLVKGSRLLRMEKVIHALSSSLPLT